ncbi:MAG: uroporphyrinogen-III synthase [Pseudomonadota bacterium]
MADAASVLVLTRPEAQSQSFLDAVCAGLKRNADAIISPVLRIEPVSFDVRLEDYRTIIVTSQNALPAAGSRLKGLQVRTVGAGTAVAAQRLGADAMSLGKDVDDLLKRSDEIEGPVIHLRGTHTRGDLVKRLRQAGIIAEGCVVYDQVAQQLTPEAQAALANGSAIVPVFSPRSAALVSAHIVHEGTLVIAISETTAAEWNAPGQIRVANRPDLQAMLVLTHTALSADHLVAPPPRR